MTLARTGVALLILGILSGPAAAQDRSLPARRPFSPKALERIVDETARARNGRPLSQTSTSASARRKDSIINGSLIGAAIGGVGGSALLVAARGGSDDFRGAMLNVSPWTALGGFAVGAIIDALQ